MDSAGERAASLSGLLSGAADKKRKAVETIELSDDDDDEEDVKPKTMKETMAQQQAMARRLHNEPAGAAAAGAGTLAEQLAARHHQQQGKWADTPHSPPRTPAKRPQAVRHAPCIGLPCVVPDAIAHQLIAATENSGLHLSGRVQGRLKGRAIVGTSAMDKVGFAFDWWLQHKTPEKPYLFYPKSFKSKNAAGLHEYYANRLGAVEINTTHYHYLPPHTYKSWAKLAGNYPESVGGYDLIIKANKDFTHNYKLLLDDEFKERWKSQSDCVKTLGGNCPAIVMSFPHGFRCTPKELYVAGEKKGQVKKAATHERLRKFAAWLKQTEAPGLANPLIVFEFRHESWFCQDVYDIIQAEPRFVLAQLHVWSREDMSGGLWVGDLPDGWWPRDNATVARINQGKALYLRLHGSSGESVGDYKEDIMAQVAGRMKSYLDTPANQTCKAFCFLNNTNSHSFKANGEIGGNSAISDAYCLTASLSQL